MLYRRAQGAERAALVQGWDRAVTSRPRVEPRRHAGGQALHNLNEVSKRCPVLVQVHHIWYEQSVLHKASLLRPVKRHLAHNKVAPLSGSNNSGFCVSLSEMAAPVT